MAQISFDATSSGTTASANSGTISHTCAAASLLLVGVGINNGTDIVTGVTYGGSAMTIGTTVAFGGGSSDRAYIYFITPPLSGANDIVVTTSAATIKRITGASYVNTKTTGQPDAGAAVGQTDGANTSVAGTVTSVADNCWFAAFGVNNIAEFVAGANTTIRGTASSFNICDSAASKSPPGAGTLSLTWTGADNAGFCMLSIAPTPGGDLDLTSKVW